MINLQDESGRRWITAALVAAALLSGAYWTEATLLRVRQGMPDGALAAGASNTASIPFSSSTAPPPEVLARLLGAQPSAPAVVASPAERFKVMGVIASASGQGTALVAVDGQPPRPFKVGAELAPGFVIRSVSQKELTLATRPGGDALVTLPLPEPGTAVAGSNNAVGPVGGEPLSGPQTAGSRSNPRGQTTPPATPSATAPAAPSSASP